MRTRRGGAWSMVSVREVLRNAVYVGLYRRLGVTVPTEHEALITRDRFAAVQQRLAARRTSFGKQERAAYLLTGLASLGVAALFWRLAPSFSVVPEATRLEASES